MVKRAPSDYREESVVEKVSETFAMFIAVFLVIAVIFGTSYLVSNYCPQILDLFK